jgi:hypothetical protein
MQLANRKFNIVLNILSVPTFMCMFFISACDSDDPQKENTPELITKVELTFSPAGGGDDIVVTATDPDGGGVQPIATDGPIELEAGTTYTLTIGLYNELLAPTEEGYDITEEVEAESDEHLFFFAWTNNVFSDPAGNGNIDTRSDDVNYEDEDGNSLPLGLATSWTAASAAADGTFRIVLKHQPGLKSAVSTAADGETDLDLTFDINVE